MIEILKKQTSTLAKIVFLSGELGAGKTELVRLMAKKLKTTDRVQSPTFVIMRHLKTEDSVFKIITHLDAYRLTEKADLEKLGFEKLLKDKDRLIFIEWPENVSGVAVPDISVLIEIKADKSREFKISTE